MKSIKLPQFVIWRTATLVVFNLFLIGNAIWLRRYIVRHTGAITDTKASEQATAPASTFNRPSIGAVAALGTIEPQGEVVRVAPSPSLEGSLLNKLLVEVGEQVTAGQTIAILDNRDRLEADVSKAKVQVKTAQARLQQVLAGASQGEIAAQRAQINNLAAELNGQRIAQTASITSLETELQRSTQTGVVNIARLQAELDNAQRECDRFTSLYHNGAVSDSEQDSICLQAITASQRLAEAKVDQQLNRQSLRQGIREAQANLQRTEITLKEQQLEARANLERIVEIRPTDIAVAQAEVEEAEAAMKQAQIELQDAYVRSPQNGQVLQINARVGERITEKGILELGQTERMIVRAEVYETDIALVHRGQPASITSSGFPGELKGTVEQIDLQIGKKDVLGTDPIAEADSRVVEVKIILEPKASQQVAHLTNLQVYTVIDTGSATSNTTAN